MLKAGIVGCGNIYPMHAYSLQDLSNGKLAAVCDIDGQRAKKAAGQFDCAYYTDYKDMIDHAGIDVVHICLPHYLHKPVTVYAAEAKKHVLTEKPMATTVEDAQAMERAALDNGVTLGVIFQNRYNQGALLVKDTLQSGAAGNVLGARFHVDWFRDASYYKSDSWRGRWDTEGGGVMINQAIHTLDMVRWFIDSDIDTVDTHIANRTLQDVIEVEDEACGLIRFKNGVKLHFSACNYNSCNAPIAIELQCEKALIQILGDRASIRFHDGREWIAENNPNETFHYGAGAKGYWGVNHTKQIRNFYEALEQGIPPEITAAEGVKTQRLVCAIYESAKNGKAIRY